MNREDEEFTEADEYISCHIRACDVKGRGENREQIEINKDASSLAVWSRDIFVGQLLLSIKTPAFGGTKHAGRKLFPSSIVLGMGPIVFTSFDDTIHRILVNWGRKKVYSE